jgi:hypothetical protein
VCTVGKGDFTRLFFQRGIFKVHESVFLKKKENRPLKCRVFPVTDKAGGAKIKYLNIKYLFI